MRKLIICIFMVLGGYLFSFAQHPSLLFTQEEVNEMRAGKGTVPAFDKSLSEVLAARFTVWVEYPSELGIDLVTSRSVVLVL